jgi:uncharacterized cupin superfamily protein
MHVVNVVSVEPDETFGRGAFHAGVFELTERLGASVIGAGVYEMRVGEKRGPYHYHYGVEEWLYVVSGAPLLRDFDGERVLEPGELVAFRSGPSGAHTVHGAGRVLMFSAGARGWGEAFVTVYPDSDKLGAAPGVMFRRADAIDTSLGDEDESPAALGDKRSTRGPGSPAVNLRTVPLQSAAGERSSDEVHIRKASLGPWLGAETWAATLYELGPGEATTAYHYTWCREEWALVISGAPTLRHADGQTMLSAGDICCFPQGPTGAHQLRNEHQDVSRVIVFSTSTDRPMSTFYPDEGTVLICISDRERLLFRHDDRIEDYWDGEPGAK